MTYSIKIEGSGTPNQLAIRLLELGRQLQLAELNGDFNELDGKTLEDDCLITEVNAE